MDTVRPHTASRMHPPPEALAPRNGPVETEFLGRTTVYKVKTVNRAPVEPVILVIDASPFQLTDFLSVEQAEALRDRLGEAIDEAGQGVPPGVLDAADDLVASADRLDTALGEGRR